mmetsp:Transcript_23940/g.70525  ORF Transcript_23940/g.70525 Transcript_23940/m.70525 type:complete len:203 (-) Transcript_23940:266-874(-)
MQGVRVTRLYPCPRRRTAGAAARTAGLGRIPSLEIWRQTGRSLRSMMRSPSRSMATCGTCAATCSGISWRACGADPTRTAAPCPATLRTSAPWPCRWPPRRMRPRPRPSASSSLWTRASCRPSGRAQQTRRIWACCGVRSRTPPACSTPQRCQRNRTRTPRRQRAAPAPWLRGPPRARSPAPLGAWAHTVTGAPTACSRRDP